MKFRFVQEHCTVFPVRRMCAVLDVSPAGYYAWRGRPESYRSCADRELLAEVQRIHADSNRRYGSPRVHATLRAEGRRVGRSRVERLLRRHGIQANRRRAFRRTTDSHHAFLPAPNLLARNFEAARPNQIWLADMTYIRTGEGWLYLAAILDLFSRKIAGWARPCRRN
jgi:transposase InsO family protein